MEAQEAEEEDAIQRTSDEAHEEALVRIRKKTREVISTLKCELIQLLNQMRSEGISLKDIFKRPQILINFDVNLKCSELRQSDMKCRFKTSVSLSLEDYLNNIRDDA